LLKGFFDLDEFIYPVKPYANVRERLVDTDRSTKAVYYRNHFAYREWELKRRVGHDINFSRPLLGLKDLSIMHTGEAGIERLVL